MSRRYNKEEREKVIRWMETQLPPESIAEASVLLEAYGKEGALQIVQERIRRRPPGWPLDV